MRRFPIRNGVNYRCSIRNSRGCLWTQGGGERDSGRREKKDSGSCTYPVNWESQDSGTVCLIGDLPSERVRLSNRTILLDSFYI